MATPTSELLWPLGILIYQPTMSLGYSNHSKSTQKYKIIFFKDIRMDLAGDRGKNPLLERLVQNAVVAVVSRKM
jgi:hypothetical protein